MKIRRTRRFLCISLVLILLLLSACGTGSTGQGTGKGTGQKTPGDVETALEIQTLQEFCADAELDAWFASLDTNPPVKLEYWIYGYAPYSMEFTDPDLILQTAMAMRTVRIDGPAEEDPDLVSDAGGTGYYFEMEDGSRMYFSFLLGSFRWNGDVYHKVADYGDLRELSAYLLEIGNPQLTYVYSRDRGYYTQALETYETAWQDEEAPFGGILIFTNGTGEIPFVQVSRLEGDPANPEKVLKGELADRIGEDVEELGCVVRDCGEVQEYEFGRQKLPGMLFTLDREDGTSLQLLALVLKTRDSLLGEDHLVRFCAVYDETDEDGRDTIMNVLDTAVREFNLKQMTYEKGEVRPGSKLLDFCNDDALRAWFEQAMIDPPDELTYVEDTWYSITDRDTILQVLIALQDVTIGGESDAHVGGSGRRIFDFYYDDGGDLMSFAFFVDTFSYETGSYDVLDWGGLKKIDLKKAASAAGR